MSPRVYIRSTIWLCVLLGAAMAKAQDQPKTEPEQPLPPLAAENASSPSAGAAEVPYSDPEPAVVTDSRPITGFQNLSLGLKAVNRNILLPSFAVSTSIQSSPYQNSATNNPGIDYSTVFVGRLVLNHTSKASALSLDYTAGATFPSDPNQNISGLQSLGFSESIQRGRWSFQVGDQLFYSSNSPFGFGGLGGIGNYGMGLNDGGTGLRPGVAPDQSIPISGEAQLSNAVEFQTGYALSHRSYFTVGMTYGVLDMVGSKLQNNSDIAFQSGYGYMVTRRDSIALSYGYSRFMFSSGVPSPQDHVLQFTYARQIAGRISLRAGAGPSIQVYKSPLSGPARVVSWAATVSGSYSLGYLSTSLSYSHGQTGGSGIFPGAETDSLTASMSRSIGREWSGTLSTGYGRSRAFQQTSAAASLNSPEAFFVVATASRRIFQRGSLSLSYGVSRQLNLAAVCPLSVCQVGALTQNGSIGYSWSLRPISLE